LLSWTGIVRVRAIRTGAVQTRDIALDPQAWPANIRAIANCYRNQFELPVLFYLAVIVALITNKVSVLMIVLAWVFVASRIVHAGIHTRNKNVRHRFFAFAGGVLTLLIIWLVLILRVVFEGV
jgi:hypothetical protein